MTIYREYSVNPNLVVERARVLASLGNKVITYIAYDSESQQFYTEWKLA